MILRHKHLGVKFRSKQSEKRFARVLGGRTQPNSGALSHAKGDVTSDHFLGEDKFTDAQSYSITRKVWDKICGEAFAKRKRPLLRITIAGETLYVMDGITFDKLVNEKF